MIMRRIYAVPLLALMALLFASISAKSQNLGFEAASATPPTNWTVVTLVWSNNTDATYVRTGSKSMTVTDPATSGSTAGNTSGFTTTAAAGSYIITIGWGKSNTASNAAFYLGYKNSAGTNTLNPSTTTTPPAAYQLNNTTWTRIASASAATVAAGSYGPAIRAFRVASTTGTVVYMDDFITYASPSNVPDLTAPNPATGVSLAGNSLSWTNGSDNGAPASGIGGVVILRGDGISLAAPTLNDQGMYSATNGAAGTSSFVQGGVTWTVLADIAGSATTTYTDATASGGPYTYAIFMHDLAYNYSTGVTAGVSSPCTTPPTAGASTVNPSTAVCAGTSRALGLTGNSFGTGQSYQWQSSSTLAGSYSNVGTSSSGSGLTVNPTVTTYYRCAVTCGASTVNAAPVEVLVNPALPAGTYTINSAQPTGGTNYQTFADAINGLGCGIAGPIVYNVAPGTYNEQVTIPQIAGASATNTITFNGNGATLDFGALATTALRSGITLNGADHIIIDSLNINGSAGTFAWGITLTNQADSNIIRKCNINIGNLTATTTNFIGVVLNGSVSAVTTSGNNANGNLFDRNTIVGGYYGFYAYGNSSSSNLDNKFTNNIIQDMYAYGVYMLYQSNTVISKNDISRPTRTSSTTVAGVYASTSCVGILIEKNRIHNLFDALATSTSAAYPIYISTAGTATQVNRIENNLIYNINSATSGAVYGIYGTATSYSYWNVYHNTIILDEPSSTTGTTYGIYLYGAAGVNIKNNIVSIARGGTGTKYCLYYSTVGVASSNNNVLLMTSTGGTTNSIGYYNAGYATLGAWQAANAAVYDQQSISTDPLFVSAGTGDYTPSAVPVNDIGANVGVTTDILNNARSSNPDPGAYEFSLGACTNPPTPGTAISTQNITCSGVQFTLDLIGNSVGANQTYQWQSSPNDLAPWTDVGTASTVANYTTSQTSSKYYRCAVKCGTGTVVYSTSVFVNTPAAVSGIFTINGTQPTSGNSFQTFAEAMNYIKCSIGGPVVFNVAPGTGPYNEQVIIPQITGASPTNTVTINGNGETLTYTSANTAERAVLKLNGADYFIINNLHIIAPGTATTEYGYGIQLVNDADSNTIANCVIDITQAPATAASTSFAGIVVNSTAATTPLATGDSKCDKNTIINNTITGGYVGISLVASGTTSIINQNKVLKNIISEFYTYGVYANGNTNLLVDSNEVSRPTRSSVIAFNGIYFTGVSTNSTVSRNRLHDPFGGALASTTLAAPIYFTTCDATAGNENTVANNLVYNMFGGTGNHNGFLNNSSDYVKVYHNTFSLDDISASCACPARGIYVQTTTVAGLDIRNNIISVSRGGTGEKQGIYFEPTSVSTYTLDNNNYFMNGSGGTQEVGHIGTTGYTTLTAWQTATSKEANSKDMDPLFANISTGDFKPLSSVIDNMGVPVGIANDINGAARSLVTPDAGAYEFSNFTAGINMGAEALVSPAASSTGCYGAAETVTIRIRNSSSAMHNFVTNPVTVNVNVTGQVTQNLSVVVNTGTLASSDILNVSMPATLNMSVAGTYTFNASTSLTGDANTANDAMPSASRTKVLGSAGAVAVAPNNYCIVGGKPVLSTVGATGYSSLQWQQSSLPTTGFVDIASATTNPYTLTTNATQTTYYRLMVTCASNRVDSSVAMLTFSNPSVVSTTPRTRCGAGVVNLGATPSAGATISWYTASTGGSPLTSGNTFTTPSISNTTTYYAGANNGGSTAYVGKYGLESDANGTGGGLASYINFDATSDFVLKTVDLFPYATTAGTSGTITIELRSSTGASLMTKTVNVTGAGSTVATTTRNTVALDFPVTGGASYRLGVTAWTGATNLFRDGTNVVYPFTLSGVVNIPSSSLAPYYYFFYNWQVSTGCESARTAVVATVDNTPGCSAVPIILLSFKGEKQGAINKLEWTTSTEINNAGFELQRSADGTSFSQLAYVASKAINGNSNSQLAYSINDVKPLLGNGYYRLKQVDKDGKSSHSSIVLLKGSKPTSLAISSVYPNPSVKELNMVLLSPIADDVKIVVTDITGKILLQKAVTVAQGDNKVQLNVQSLSQGTYIVKAVCSNGCETAVHRFVKQ